MFNQLCKHKLKAKRSKCEFACACVKYLGHVVGSGKLRVDLDKVLAVDNWAALRDIKGVKQFLGYADYYNHFIRGFARVVAPTCNLLSNRLEFVWGEE